MSSKSISIRTEAEILEQLSALARTLDRSRNWVIEDALKQYLAQQARYAEGIAQARASLARGERIPHEDLVAELNALIEEQAPGRDVGP